MLGMFPGNEPQSSDCTFMICADQSLWGWALPPCSVGTGSLKSHSGFDSLWLQQGRNPQNLQRLALMQRELNHYWDKKAMQWHGHEICIIYSFSVPWGTIMWVMSGSEIVSIEEENHETWWPELHNPVLCLFTNNGLQIFFVLGVVMTLTEREGREQKRPEREQKWKCGRLGRRIYGLFKESNLLPTFSAGGIVWRL